MPGGLHLNDMRKKGRRREPLVSGLRCQVSANEIAYAQPVLFLKNGRIPHWMFDVERSVFSVQSLLNVRPINEYRPADIDSSFKEFNI